MSGNPLAGPGRKRTVPTIPILAFIGLLATLGFAYQAGFLGLEASPEAEPPTEIVVSSQRLDFGTIPPNGSATRQLVMRNEGAEAVQARLVAEDASFTVSPDSVILHPGISSRISVAVAARAEGEFNDKLRIEIEDANASTLLIALAGRVAADEPELALPASGPAPRRLRVSTTDGQRRIAALDSTPNRRTVDSTRKPASAAAAGNGVLIAGTKTARKPTASGRTEGTPDKTSRKPVTSDRERPRDESGDSGGRDRRSLSINVQPYDPATAVPFRDLTEMAPPAREQITPQDAENAGRIPSRVPGGNDNELPDRLPEEDEREMFDDDIFDDSEELGPNEDPVTGPALRISGVSSVRILGSAASFYPQEIGIVGQGAGGPLSLMQSLQFPIVPLAFGESMLFAPTRGVAGSFDPSSGEVTLELGVQAVDSDGDAAPLNFNMTTGTTFARNQSGLVVSISGTPRAADTGMVRLVGIEKIPVGYRNGAEQHLVIVEILAALDFGTSIQPSRPSRMGRIGG